MTAAATGLVGIALDGFTQARIRLTRTLEETKNLYAITVPVMEIAYWARTVDEQLAKADPAYMRSRHKPAGTVIRGLQWLRNQSTHALPLTVRAVGGLTAPITTPITITPVQVFWHHADQLPPEDPNLLEPLEDVAQWFAAERARPGSLLAAA
ncbi:hypothetical protein [Kitasatospora sp. CB01950]|uniref:hypothetical protein n=1 Tax=Kitasatospora sp. CB01950 TaxID=1703930 RepID=UPI00093B7F65|nr:hypothetical protein [Kitasatospora sp. CB01950]OKI95125.1 hypothetical protein AMK19_33220 [Kitasatospora sp. CB01950]